MIISIAVAKGATHDFSLFQQSKNHIHPEIILIADKGYVGIDKLHKRSITPFKAKKKRPLSDREKIFNSYLSRIRIPIEHINRRVKRFKIFQSRYHNKQKKFLLRFSLICGFYNFELKC
jgi:hypothetical protein